MAIFTEKSQQQMLGLYIRRAELAGFVPRKEDDAPCLLCITLKHIALSPRFLQRSKGQTCGPELRNFQLTPSPHFSLS